MLRPCIGAVVALVLLASPSLAQDVPQDDVMVHVDAGSGALRFIPSEFTIVPGGMVQLMIFGQGSGSWSLTLDDAPELSAEVDTSREGFVHVAELRAPATPGRYAFHDRHHPEARGVLTVAQRPAGAPEVGVGDGYDTRFYPARLELDAGAAFTFRNNASEIVHTFTLADGTLDTDRVEPGGSRELRAPSTPGEQAFLCKYHEGMRGTLVVRAASPPTVDEARETPGAPAIVLFAAVALLALAIGRGAPRWPQR